MNILLIKGGIIEYVYFGRDEEVDKR